tara:strand:- start:1512 stop:1781 length:270 start_codon:yes stop_codon:yes gene_type:complete
VSKRKQRKLDKWGYYLNSEDTTEARAHGFEPKNVERVDRKETKRDYRLDKTAQKTELLKAKGTRLKWLVILIGLIMMGFGAFKAGIFGG